MPLENNIKWAASLSHVREVSLLGTADLGYWADRLRHEELNPRDHEGRAQIMILGASARFMGLRFREISISVQIQNPALENGEAVFLVSAFNSRRFFAFCERVFFKTPYYHADVQLDCTPASLRIGSNGQTVFDARMSPAPTRQPSQHPHDRLESRVFLPSLRPSSSGGPKFFIARLAGHAERYAWLPTDSLTITPRQPNDVLSALLDSHFTPREWLLRPDATHAKSKTYRHSDALMIL